MPYFSGGPCDTYLVNGYDPVPETSLTATTSYDDVHGPHNARLNKNRSATSAGAWSAASSETVPYIQVCYSVDFKNVGLQ